MSATSEDILSQLAQVPHKKTVEGRENLLDRRTQLIAAIDALKASALPLKENYMSAKANGGIFSTAVNPERIRDIEFIQSVVTLVPVIKASARAKTTQVLARHVKNFENSYAAIHGVYLLVLNSIQGDYQGSIAAFFGISKPEHSKLFANLKSLSFDIDDADRLTCFKTLNHFLTVMKEGESVNYGDEATAEKYKASVLEKLTQQIELLEMKLDNSDESVQVNNEATPAASPA